MFGQHPCKGKAPFFRPIPNSHKVNYTTVDWENERKKRLMIGKTGEAFQSTIKK
jgi:hypothetical protein